MQVTRAEPKLALVAVDGEADAAAPHHRLEVAFQLLGFFVMAADLELREVELRLGAEEIDVHEAEGAAGVQGPRDPDHHRPGRS
ncbi:MAG: hypothetical protein U0793_02875 [Gemmataceae bacterium]